MTKSNLGQPVKNKHKVPKKMWNKWSNHAKKVFNDMYYSLRPSMQWAFKHPDAVIEKKEHWGTTRWNVAFEAACNATDGTRLGKVVIVKSKARRKK